MERAKLFKNGQSQAVRLPKHLRFDGTEVYARKLGNAVILLPVNDPWGPLREALSGFSEDFMAERSQPQAEEREGLDWVFLLDTNICIYLIRKQPAKVLERLMACSPEDVALSVVTLSELAYGVSKSQAQEKNREALELFLSPFQVLDYPAEAAFAYGHIRAELERKGTPIGGMDLMIAAHAMATGATVVSNNLKEFRRVSGLKTENWAR